VAGRTLFQFCEGEGITALDVDSGDRLWQVKEAGDVVGTGIDHVSLYAPATREILKVQMSDGEIVVRRRLPLGLMPVRNIGDDTLYLATRDGRMLCGKPVGKPYLTPEELALARRAMRKVHGADAGTEQLDSDLPQAERDRSGIDMNDPLRSDDDVSPLGGSR
jgi:hypothetical protein